MSNSITAITDGTFAYNQLTSVTIPNSVTTIEGSAFHYNNISSITIGQNVSFKDSLSYSPFDDFIVATYQGVAGTYIRHTIKEGNYYHYEWTKVN